MWLSIGFVGAKSIYIYSVFSEGFFFFPFSVLFNIFLYFWLLQRKTARLSHGTESSRSSTLLVGVLSVFLSFLLLQYTNTLASGSERVSQTQSSGSGLVEASHINKSLFTLGKVISSLTDRRKAPSKHVPFRDSKLTKLLNDSIGGTSMTLMVGFGPLVDFLSLSLFFFSLPPSPSLSVCLLVCPFISFTKTAFFPLFVVLTRALRIDYLLFYFGVRRGGDDAHSSVRESRQTRKKQARHRPRSKGETRRREV